MSSYVTIAVMNMAWAEGIDAMGVEKARPSISAPAPAFPPGDLPAILGGSLNRRLQGGGGCSPRSGDSASPGAGGCSSFCRRLGIAAVSLIRNLPYAGLFRNDLIVWDKSHLH